MAFTRVEDCIEELPTDPFEGLGEAPKVEFKTLKEVYETVAAEANMTEQNVRKTVRAWVSKYFDDNGNLYQLYLELLEMAKTPAGERQALQASKLAALKSAIPTIEAELEDYDQGQGQISGGLVRLADEIQAENEYAGALASLGSCVPIDALIQAAKQKGQLAGAAEASSFLRARRETSNRIFAKVMAAELDATEGV